MRSFSLRTLRSSGTRSIFNLQIDDFQLVATQELRIGLPAFRARGAVHRRGVRVPTRAALIAARAVFDFESKRLEVCTTHQSLEAKTHRVRIDAGELTDAQAYFVDVAIRKATSLRTNRVEHRICDSHLVHRNFLSGL